MASIKLNSVSLKYPPKYKYNLRLLQRISRHLYARKNKAPITNSKILALDNIDLTMDHNDIWGIIGQNGSGKSSLLKLMAGIYQPTTGTITVDGRVNTIFMPALGFNNEISGYENIYHKGLLLGMTLREISMNKTKIIELSELDAVIHRPMYTYSSGMRTRLACALALSSRGNILLCDEIFGSLDYQFLSKLACLFKEESNRGSLIIFVSHSSDFIRQFTTKTIWLDHGKVHAIGDSAAILEAYQKNYLKNGAKL